MNGNRARRRAVCLSHVLLVSLGLGSALPAQERPTCPRTTARLLDDGWRLLRTDSAAASASRFSAALSECPASADAMVGLGFAALRRGQVVQAESLFVDVTRRVPAYVDAWDGLGSARFRQGQAGANVAHPAGRGTGPACGG